MLKQYFTGNRDQNTVKSYALVPNIRARFIRIRPWGWYGHISMRAEFYGCLTGSWLYRLLNRIEYDMKNYEDWGGCDRLRARGERRRPSFISVVPGSIPRFGYWPGITLLVSGSAPRSCLWIAKCFTSGQLDFLIGVWFALFVAICFYGCLWGTIKTTGLTEIVIPL